MARNPAWRGLAATWMRAHRRLDHALQSGRSACRSISSSISSACMATSRWQTSYGVRFRRRAGQCSPLPNCWRRPLARLRPASRCLAASAPRAAVSISKKTGLFGIVTTARVLAIRHHLLERSTPARLSAVAALGRGGGLDLDALARAHAEFLDLILAQQIADIHDGRPPNNKVLVKRLSRDQRMRLREALRAVRHLDALTHDLLF